MLTPHEIEVIKSTAPALAEHGEAITGRFYELLFAAHPELENIFNMTNQRTGSQKHALATAVYAFANYVDQLEVLLGDVERIAQKHASLGIRAEHYPLVGSALLEAIRQVLNPPQEIIDAWASGYGVLSGVFIAREQALYQEKADRAGGWRDTRPFKVANKVKESEFVTSFYLAPADGKPIATFTPGQYIAVYFTLPDGRQQIRQYSLSASRHDQVYRISVKRERHSQGDGVISNHLHDNIAAGDEINISNPFGEFYLQDSDRPVVLISGGVGITPMQSMLETLSAEPSGREIHFVHGTVNSAQHSFAERLAELAGQRRVASHVFYEQPLADDRRGERFQYEGRIDMAALAPALPMTDAEFYLCGPLPMMQAVFAQLRSLGVAETQIFYEVFGPTKSLAA